MSYLEFATCRRLSIKQLLTSVSSLHVRSSREAVKYFATICLHDCPISHEYGSLDVRYDEIMAADADLQCGPHERPCREPHNLTALANTFPDSTDSCVFSDLFIYNVEMGPYSIIKVVPNEKWEGEAKVGKHWKGELEVLSNFQDCI